MYPNSIKNVIDCLKDLPGIGEKTAERLAFSLINFDKDKLTLFSESICGVRDKITNCQICGNICESDVCPICLDKERNGNLIFVVEKAKDISLFEKINVYNHGQLQDFLILPDTFPLTIHFTFNSGIFPQLLAESQNRCINVHDNILPDHQRSEMIL